MVNRGTCKTRNRSMEIVPIKIEVNTVSRDDAETLIYNVRLFGVTVFRKVVENHYVDSQKMPMGFNVFPDMRQYVDDEDE